MEIHQTYPVKDKEDFKICCFTGKPRAKSDSFDVHDGFLRHWLCPREEVDVTVFRSQDDVKAVEEGLHFVQKLIEQRSYTNLKVVRWWTPQVSDLDYRFWTKKSKRTLQKDDSVLVQRRIPEDCGRVVEYKEGVDQTQLADVPVLAELVSDSVRHSDGSHVISSLRAVVIGCVCYVKFVTLRAIGDCSDRAVRQSDSRIQPTAPDSGGRLQPSAPVLSGWSVQTTVADTDVPDGVVSQTRLQPTAPRLEEGQEPQCQCLSCFSVHMDPLVTDDDPPPPYSEIGSMVLPPPYSETAITGLLSEGYRSDPPPPYCHDS